MSDPFDNQPFPRGALIAAGLLVLGSLAAVAAVRVTGEGMTTTPPATTIAERELRFADRTDGGVDVIDARSGDRLDVLKPGTEGFVRATLRSLVRDRKRQGIGAETPFKLAAGEGGRLTLLDPATGRRVDLEAFGQTNAAAFARLLGPPS